MISVITKSVFLTICSVNGHQHSSADESGNAVRVNTEIKSRHIFMNENGLHHPLIGNMKNKDLPVFITYSTINKKYNKKKAC